MAGSSPEYYASFAALIIAAAAFVVACLQTISQYISSTENRNKCSSPAIGWAHRNVKHRWSWSCWRFKVYYPLLDFSFPKIVELFVNSGMGVIVERYKLPSPKKRLQTNWTFDWRAMDLNDNPRFWHVGDSLAIMVKRQIGGQKKEGEKMVSIWDFDFVDKLKFIYWRWRNPTWLFSPRASWAQLFLALDVKDVTPIFLKGIDADAIPSSLDVPVQRVGLRDIGKLALFLGFSSVKINQEKRIFTAQSPFATISTEEVPVLGKVLRFEGDIMALHCYTCRGRTYYMLRGVRLASGEMSFGRYVTSGFAIPVETLGSAIKNGRTSDEYDEDEKVSLISDIGIPDQNVNMIKAGYLVKEAAKFLSVCSEFVESRLIQEKTEDVSRMEALHRLKSKTSDGQMEDHKNELLLEELGGLNQVALESTFSKWQSYTGRAVPTVFLLSTMCSLHSVTCGFPSRAILREFMPWFRYRARKLYDKNCSAEQAATHLVYFESPNLLIEMERDTFPFARSSSNFLLSKDGGSVGGLYCWTTDSMKPLWEACPKLVKNEVIAHGQAEAVLTRDTVDVLKNFDVEGWLKHFAHSHQGSFSGLKHLNLLWIQIIILDFAIQHTIRDGWGDGDADLNDPDPIYNECWQPQESNVGFAITQSWRLPTDSTATKDHKLFDWDLLGALREYSGITEDGNETALTSRLEKLADLLELRGLVWIFFMLCHADSSDIYLMMDDNIELPMV